MSSRTADRASALSALLTTASPAEVPGEPADLEDQDTGDIPAGVDEDQLDHDELDTDQIARPD